MAASLEMENHPAAKPLQIKFSQITMHSDHFGTEDQKKPTTTTSGCDETSVQANDSEGSIEIVEHTCVDMARLQLSEEADIRRHSTTNKGVPETQEQHYDKEREEDNGCFQRRDSYLFLMCTPKQRRSDCACDESTEVLLIDCDVCSDELSSHQNYYSGTDSDVEVLMTEEINESEWAEGVSDAKLPVLEDEEGCSDAPAVNDVSQDAEAVQIIATAATSPSVSMKKQESTDQDVSVEELSCSSVSSYGQLSRSQLLEVIREQTNRICQLEAIIESYRNSQQTIFRHVDAIRVELCATCESDFQKSHNTIH